LTAPAAPPVSRDPMTVLTGFQARASQLIADMQAAAKLCPILAFHLDDAIGRFDDARGDSLDYEIGLLEAAEDAKDSAAERRHEAELRSDYLGAVL
jgi:hypothetical protein